MHAQLMTGSSSRRDMDGVGEVRTKKSDGGGGGCFIIIINIVLLLVDIIY